MAKVCCCSLTLHEGALGIAVLDLIVAIIVFVFTIIMSILVGVAIHVDADREVEAGLFVFMFWLTSILFSLRAASGLLAWKRNQTTAKCNFYFRAIIDVAWIFFYICIALAYWISTVHLSLILVNFSMNGYLDWVLYSLWKSPSAAQKPPASNSSPPRNYVVNDGEFQKNTPASPYE